MTASQKLGEKMYADMQAEPAGADAASGMGAGAQQAAAGGSGRGGAQQSADDDVVDAEVKEVKRG